MVGLEDPRWKEMEEDKKNFKNHRKLNKKARFILYQCVSYNIFNKISKVSITKEVWEILIKAYKDGDKNKKVKLQTLRQQFEFLNIEENGSIADYFDKA